MIVGIPKETFLNENRVAVTADIAPFFIKSGMKLVVESGAGLNAGISDEFYKEKGVEVVASRKDVFDKSHVILQVRGYGANPVNGSSDLDLLRDDQSVVSFFEPLTATLPVRGAPPRMTIFSSIRCPSLYPPGHHYPGEAGVIPFDVAHFHVLNFIYQSNHRLFLGGADFKDETTVFA